MLLNKNNYLKCLDLGGYQWCNGRCKLTPETYVISKIESIMGIKNLGDIASRSHGLLLDRGDMSRQVPIEQIPRVQKEIIKRAKQANVEMFVATN